MNRAILILVLSGFSILVANLFFNFIPISIFPCTLTPLDHETIQSVCSIAQVMGRQEYAIARLTGCGEIVRFLVTWLAPIVGSIAIVLSTSKRQRNRTESNIEQLP